MSCLSSDQLVEAKSAIAKIPKTNTMIKIWIDGIDVDVEKSILAGFPNSYFASVLSERWDKKAEVIIEEEPSVHFHIVQKLFTETITQELLLSFFIPFKQSLYETLDYFCLPPLLEWCEMESGRATDFSHQDVNNWNVRNQSPKWDSTLIAAEGEHKKDRKWIIQYQKDEFFPVKRNRNLCICFFHEENCNCTYPRQSFIHITTHNSFSSVPMLSNTPLGRFLLTFGTYLEKEFTSSVIFVSFSANTSDVVITDDNDSYFEIKLPSCTNPFSFVAQDANTPLCIYEDFRHKYL